MRQVATVIVTLFVLATALLPAGVFVSEDSAHRSPTLAATWKEATNLEPPPNPCWPRLIPGDPRYSEPRKYVTLC